MRPAHERKARCVMAALAHPMRLSIYRAVLTTPGVVAKALAEAELVSPSTLNYHMRTLVDAGLLFTLPSGNAVQYFPVLYGLDVVEKTLEELQGALRVGVE